MDTGLDKAKLLHYRGLLAKYLGDPLKLRLAVVIGVVGLTLGAAYLPLSGQIDQRQNLLAAEEHRAEGIKDVETLRKQIEGYRDRLSTKSDTNEWVQYILGGLREAQVKLRDMESKEPQRVGPYRAVILAVEVEGPYPRLKKFVEWLEASNRLVRIDSIRLEKRPTEVLMKIVLLGLVDTNAPANQ